MAHEILKFLDYCMEETGVNPLFIYCQVTGKPIGYFNVDLMAEAIEEEGGIESDWEALAEALLTRTLSSMRPSPGWNMLDRDSLKRFCQSKPDETLSYLINRLYEPGPSLKLDFFQRLSYFHARIRTYDLVKQIVDSGLDISELVFILIEIDALYNLTKLPSPKMDVHSLMVELMNDHELFPKFVDGFRSWSEPLIASYEKRQREAIRQDAWLKGNPMAQSARVDLYRQSKPKSEATIAKETRAKMENSLTNMLRDIMRSAETQTPPPAPAKKPVVGFIRKLNIAAFKAAN